MKFFSLKNAIHSLFCLVLLSFAGGEIFAQSLNPASPAPIRSTNLLGKIAARDLGDSRLTDHYYAFTGTPGDLLITVQSRNLNGDLDVFTAGTLRPLLKLTLYAESTTPVTKGIYLRKREDLILRIEARSPNDDEGSYQLFFGGSFEPIAGGSDITEEETPAETATTGGTGKTKRVSSVGARLPEPPEVAAAPTPTPEPTPEEKAAETAEPLPKATAPKSSGARNSTRGTTSRTTRTPTGRRTTTPTTVKPKATETPVVTEEAKKEEETPALSEPTKPKTTGRNTRRNTPATTRAPKPEPAASEPEPESGPRLVIETNDGTLINRSMSGVRRVLVESGQVVVVGRDGKIDRIPLGNVVRMTIAP